jgi:signal transduction histidine kinase
MVVGGRTEGVLVVVRRTPGLFGEPTVWWLEMLASLGAVAVAQDAAVRFEERRARQAELMLSLADVPSEGSEPFLGRLSEAIGRAIGADRVDLLMLDPDIDQLVGGTMHVPTGADHPLARVFRSGQPWLVGDVAVDEAAQRLYARARMRSAAAVPLRVGDEVRGVLHVAASQPGALGEDDLAFLQLLAARVGLLLEREEVRQRRSDARAREEFVGVVSHELKTPVAVVQAYVELLERRAEREGREADREVLGKIGEQTSHMLAMIEELLDVQRIDAGVLHLELSRFDLAGLAERIVEGLQLTTEAHRLRVDAPQPVVAVADRRRLEEIVTNLVENAIKYAPGGGEVLVRVRAEERRGQPVARVEVRDRGVGISREDQGRIFDRFYRAGARGDRLHRGHHGLGLGLYIARQLVLRHGGEMGVESTPGQGSTFWFWVPLGGPEPEQ